MTHILVVDDEPHNRTLMEFMLLGEGYQVTTAHDGQDALRVLFNDHRYMTLPDLVLLDVMMPHLSGYEVAERIKDDPRTAHIPIVFVSAKGEPEDKVLSLETGVDYIRKPFKEGELLGRVRAVLKLHALEEELRQLRPDELRPGELHPGREGKET